MNTAYKVAILTPIAFAAYLVVTCPCDRFLSCSKNKILALLTGPGLLLLLIPFVPPL